MSLRHKVKAGLDETRLLILGAQVLFGFQLTSVFQEGFAELSHVTRIVDCAGQFLMALAIGLLIAPSMQHHISEKGRDTLRLQRATGLFAGTALLPFGISLGLSFYIVFDHLYGTMRPCIEPSNDLAPLSPFRSWLDCTTNTSGYDLRKGQERELARTVLSRAPAPSPWVRRQARRPRRRDSRSGRYKA
jgi:hypothetical protein